MIKNKYSLFLSLFALLLTLCLLFGRMAWKFNYNFNNEALELCNDIYNNCKLKVDNTIDDETFENYVIANQLTLNELISNNQESRSDYRYFLSDMSENLSVVVNQPDEVAAEFEMPKFKSYISQYNTYLFLFFMFMVFTILSITPLLIIFIKYIKSKKQCS